MSKPDAIAEVANFLRAHTDSKALAFSALAEVIVERVAATLDPEEVGLERVNAGELLAWPWWRYPHETREQFRGHGPDRYKETYPV